MTAIPNVVRLPLRFDPAALAADVERIAAGEWVRHFNTNYYDGEWSGVALRAQGGGGGQLHADPSRQDYADTEILLRVPALRAVMESFRCPLRSVRLLKLAAGSNIREHQDYDLGTDTGEVRIHVPVFTNDDVEFYLDGRRIGMRPGECWYLNLHLPHRVQNRSVTDRVHLVLDCALDDWLRELIAKGDASVPDLAGDDFGEFRRAVVADPEMQAQLCGMEDRRAFVEKVVALGRERGFRFLAGDVDAALNAARRTWLERGL